MLHSLELENFKAFGKRARIPFAPITLIFGENSAGKSTILQALNLLKQTRENRDTGALLLPRAEDGIVDLGSFQEMLFDHDLKRTLSIKVEADIDNSRMSLFSSIPHIKDKIALEFSFKRPSFEAEVLLDQIGIYDGKSAKCIAKFQPLNVTDDPEDLSMPRFIFPNSRGPRPSKSIMVKCIWLTAEPKYWKREFRWCRENAGDILEELERQKSDLEESLKRETDERRNGNESKRSDDGILEELRYLDEDLKFFKSSFGLREYISNRHQEEMNTILTMQGFLPIEIRTGKRYPRIERTRSLLYGRSDDRETFNGAELAAVAYDALEQTLEALFPIRPFRSPPQRWYIFTGTSPEHVGYQGNLLPDLLLRRPELVDETNEWLEKLNIGHKLMVKSMGADSGDLFEVRLIDTRRKKHIDAALPDVGFGISQLLPFIVQSLVAEGQIISIEQPEVHVHPRLQADLGDLLAAAIKKENPNQFLVETHSEHLILRLQRLVYKGEIKPEDVSVIYVSRGHEGAKAERLRLDEEGDFIDEWPNGFFLERLRELR